MGYSCSRGYAVEGKNHLTNKFEVIGLVKPGAGAVILVKSAVSDVVNLTKRDIVVFSGGSSDVSENNSNIALIITTLISIY
jgi:hypothetical protein